MLPARLRPPPNSSSTPHGTPHRVPRHHELAAAQVHGNHEQEQRTGDGDRRVGDSGTTRAMSGCNIQPAAVSVKTIATMRTRRGRPADTAALLVARSAPPCRAARASSSVNITRVSTRYTSGSATSTTGTPSSIHWPKPMLDAVDLAHVAGEQRVGRRADQRAHAAGGRAVGHRQQQRRAEVAPQRRCRLPGVAGRAARLDARSAASSAPWPCCSPTC
jgi:hypothetical protein